MRSYLTLTAMLCMAVSISDVAAQIIPYTPPPQQTIISELQTPRPGKGSVVIDQPAGIRHLIGVRQSNAEIETTADGRAYVKVQGFRVQVFSSNDQRIARDEALKREREMKEAIPGVLTYITLNAPFWRLRVGDYTSHEEAFYIQRQLMLLFPHYGKEMYIVKEDVLLPLDEAF
jgi:hypothetical protein